MSPLRIPIPREHGAWAMLLTSLALGQIVAWRANVASLCLWLLTIAVFVVREPLALLWRPRRADVWPRRDLLLVVAGILGASALLAGVLVATRGLALLLLGAPAGALFALQLTWQRTKARWSWPAELLGTAGVTIAAPAACFAATGTFDGVGLSLWVLLFAYFAAQVVYVRWRIRAAGDRRLGFVALGVQAFALVLFLFLGLADFLPPYVFLAFVPGVAKALFSMATASGARRRATKLGWIEAAFSMVFVVVAAVAYRVG